MVSARACMTILFAWLLCLHDYFQTKRNAMRGRRAYPCSTSSTLPKGALAQALQEIEMHSQHHIYKGRDSVALYQIAPRQA